MKFENIDFKKYLPYLIVLASFIAFIFIIVIVLDNWILPNYVQDINKVQVPDVTKKPLTEATEILSQAKLFVKKTGTQNSDEVPANCVISQSPKAGTSVKQGRHVSLTISQGKETLETPKLIGLSMTSAREMLSRMKVIGLGNPNYVSSDSVGADTIISQTPYPKQPINAGNLINITVSRGPENPIKVPTLIGRHIKDAERIISDLGLVLGLVTYKPDETFQPSTVIGQNPAAGDIVKKGAVISLSVSRK
jgi:eukaryotic-like serine/threonine-protein kinase